MRSRRAETMAEKATLAERLCSWVKLGLLAALTLYLLVDAAMANLLPGYHRHKAEQRELLCLRPVDADGQVILAAEAERRANQPVSALGKLHLFLTCADMTKVDALAGPRSRQARRGSGRRASGRAAPAAERLPADGRDLRARRPARPSTGCRTICPMAAMSAPSPTGARTRRRAMWSTGTCRS
jgi:hypothetical protein